MTRIERAPTLRPARPVVVDAPRADSAASLQTPGAIAGLAVFFRIGADALRTARPDLAAVVLAGPSSHPTDEVTLELIARVSGENRPAAFCATLHGPRGSALLPTPADVNVSITIDAVGGLIHADVADVADAGDAGQVQPLLRATTRSRLARVAPLLYARTSLLATLNLPGGRYEPDHAEVLLAGD